MRRAKGNPCALARRRLGADMHSSFFHLFFPLLIFPSFFFHFFPFPFSNFALLSFFKATPGLPVLVKHRKDGVTPVSPWSGGSENQEMEGRREGKCQ